MTEGKKKTVYGRCYCGKINFRAPYPPKSVAYCHCSDCRRVTGAPVAAFAAYEEQDLQWKPNSGHTISVNPGVLRSFCDSCGSPLTGRYDYLPGTVYIPLGIFDQPEHIRPQFHAHESNRLTWLHIHDDLERHSESARETLAESFKKK